MHHRQGEDDRGVFEGYIGPQVFCDQICGAILLKIIIGTFVVTLKRNAPRQIFSYLPMVHYARRFLPQPASADALSDSGGAGFSVNLSICINSKQIVPRSNRTTASLGRYTLPTGFSERIRVPTGRSGIHFCQGKRHRGTPMSSGTETHLTYLSSTASKFRR